MVRCETEVVAQLCADTYKKFDQALLSLRPLPAVFMPSLRKMCDLYACMYRAQCMKFLGVEAYDASYVCCPRGCCPVL